MRKTPLHKLLDLSINHSLPVLIITLALSVLFGYFAARIEMSPDVESLLPEGGGRRLQDEAPLLLATDLLKGQRATPFRPL